MASSLAVDSQSTGKPVVNSVGDILCHEKRHRLKKASRLFVWVYFCDEFKRGCAGRTITNQPSSLVVLGESMCSGEKTTITKVHNACRGLSFVLCVWLFFRLQARDSLLHELTSTGRPANFSCPECDTGGAHGYFTRGRANTYRLY